VHIVEQDTCDAAGQVDKVLVLLQLVPESRVRQGAALADASLNGALSRKITAQKDALTALQAHLAAWVDFPEEDVPELSQSHLCAVLGGVERELDALIQSYDASAVLREGVDCAIVGRPNAGKSTLLNLLATAAAAPTTG